MRTLMYLSLIILLALSCKKEKASLVENNECDIQIVDSIPEIILKSNNYFPLTVGSYWVYEFKTHNVDGTITDLNQTDTLIVIGDTIINNDTYFIFKSNFPNNNSKGRYRNSKGDIIASNGVLICPYDSTLISNYNDHYGKIGTDTIYHYWEEFSGYTQVETPFGNYDCIQKAIYHDYWPNYGVGLVIDTLYYSPIGMLQTSFSFSAGNKTVGTLIDYYLE